MIYYFAKDWDALRRRACDGHATIDQAIGCLTAAADYIYAVEDGTMRALTPKELELERQAKERRDERERERRGISVHQQEQGNSQDY